jgi:hypothetical protein
MGAPDRYKVSLHCKFCGHKGSADISEADGWSFRNGHLDRSIDRIDPGFRWVGDHSVMWNTGDFFCDCGAVASHR